MVRHNAIYHLSQQVDYQMSVISTHSEPLGRRLREGVDIVSGRQTILLNSKEEFLQGAVPSTRTQRGFGQWYQSICCWATFVFKFERGAVLIGRTPSIFFFLVHKCCSYCCQLSFQLYLDKGAWPRKILTTVFSLDLEVVPSQIQIHISPRNNFQNNFPTWSWLTVWSSEICWDWQGGLAPKDLSTDRVFLFQKSSTPNCRFRYHHPL